MMHARQISHIVSERIEAESSFFILQITILINETFIFLYFCLLLVVNRGKMRLTFKVFFYLTLTSLH